jgi:type II secretory pathway predicted ATPase ExeA
MTPFDFKDTARYIIFRQTKAGKNGNVFSRQAIEQIYRHSGGVPRKINNLCDLSLLLGFSDNKKVINSKLVESIIQDGALF